MSNTPFLHQREAVSLLAKGRFTDEEAVDLMLNNVDVWEETMSFYEIWNKNVSLFIIKWNILCIFASKIKINEERRKKKYLLCLRAMKMQFAQ